MKIPKVNNPKPVFITMNNKKYTAWTDGLGNAFYNNGKDSYAIFEQPSFGKKNKIPEENYEFDRFLTGFDF